jgi:hypothetical protein
MRGKNGMERNYIGENNMEFGSCYEHVEVSARYE